MDDKRIDLEEARRQAYNYESRRGWGVENLPTRFVGTMDRGREILDFYVDSRGNYWYKTRIRTERGIVSEYEAIFGKKEPRRFSRR